MMSRMRNCAVAAMASTMALMGTAVAQVHPLPPENSTVPASVLDNFPHREISNGILTAKVYLPVPFGFYRGTRFDHAGIVTHLTYKGQDYSRYWFDKFSPDVHDYTYTGDGTVVAHPCCAMTGPVEEFDVIGFDEAGMGGRFLKVGVGILKRDTEKYDHALTYSVLDAGKRTTTVTPDSVHFTQTIVGDPSGYDYRYAKTVTLVTGKAQMTISHVLTNTGKKDIVTKVYSHNFLTLSPGNAHMEVQAQFALKPERPLPPALAQVDGNTLRYLAPLKGQDTVSTSFTGFGDSASDYDFRIRNTATGFGERIRADQPVASINMWSISTVLGWEPYVAISLKPGETKRWTYTYDLFGPGDPS